MKEGKEFIVFCQFSAVAKKIVSASSLEEAKQIVESDQTIRFDEIIKFSEPCKVDEVLLLKTNDKEFDNQEYIEYKSWGAE